MTILQDARDRVLDLLNASGRPFEFTKRRWMPAEQLGAGEIRGAVLFHREAPTLPHGRSSAIVARRHFLAVQIVTAVADPSLIDDALEDARAWMVAQLDGATLDGLVHGLEEGETTWETAQLERIHGALTTLWRIDYQTKRSDIAQPS